MKHISIICQDDLAMTITSLLISEPVMFNIRPCDDNGEPTLLPPAKPKAARPKYKPIGRHKIHASDRSVYTVMSFAVKNVPAFTAKDLAADFLDAKLNPSSASPAISLLKKKGYLHHDSRTKTYYLSEHGKALARSFNLLPHEKKVEPYA